MAPDKGDDDSEATFAAVGRALTAWETFETTFSRLFACLVIGSWEAPTLPALRAYGAVQAFKGRADMVEAAARAEYFEDPNNRLYSDVQGLLEEARGFSGRRNEIAHGVVRPYPVFSTGPALPYFGRRTGFVLCASYYSTKKSRLAKGRTIMTPVMQEPVYVYSSAQIRKFAELFDTLEAKADATATMILRSRRRRLAASP